MPGSDSSAALPVIDVGPLTGPAPAAARARVAGQIQAACRERGFFYVTSHRVPAELLGQLAEASAEFFALPLADDSGGLQIAAPEGWIDAPPIPGTLVCNIGDMLDRLTGGWYRSTPHRVRNLSGHGRLSFPFFLDPGFDAEVPPLPGQAAAGDDGGRRWDGQDLRAFTGTYGDYLLGKVSKVFPKLRRDVLG